MKLLRSLTRRIGHRGSFLLFLSLLDLLYGYALWVTPEGNLDGILPFHVWSVIWAAMGVVALVGAFLKKDRIPFGLAAAVKASWATVWLKIWAFNSIPLAWTNVVIWSSFSGLVVIVSTWPEARRHRVIRVRPHPLDEIIEVLDEKDSS
jgi:hypothetical protein